MADKGNLYLNNQAIIDLYDSTDSYGTTVEDILYSQYKIAFKISKSNYFQGKAADSFKNYITNGTINIISELMDISSDMTMIIQMFAEAFYQYEYDRDGRVEEGALDYINQTLKSKEDTFDDAKEELNSVLRLASKYIATKGLSLQTVNIGYTETKKAVKKIRKDLYEVDDDALKYANKLFERMGELRTLIERMMVYCYNDEGKINADNLNKIQNQDWFKRAGNVTLYMKLQEDPFVYEAGSVTLSEKQWAKGLCSDIYAYAGYSTVNLSGEVGIEDGTAFAKGKATALNANAYAQLTDYLSGEANVDVIYAEGEAKAGYSEDYKGFKVDAEVGLFKADGSVVLGSEDLNAFIKGDVKVCCADGKVAFEFQDDGEFAIGVDASATVGSASLKGGTTILSYQGRDVATGKKDKPLLGFSTGQKITGGGSFALWAESKTAIETDYVNINATTIKVDAAALLGLEFTLTVPTPYFKLPW